MKSSLISMSRRACPAIAGGISWVETKYHSRSFRSVGTFGGLFFLLISFVSNAQQSPYKDWWHGKERTIHYRPEGEDFVCVDGKLRFNRALYGTNTAFRVEA